MRQRQQDLRHPQGQIYSRNDDANVQLPYTSPLTPTLTKQEAMRAGTAYDFAGNWRAGLNSRRGGAWPHHIHA